MEEELQELETKVQWYELFLEHIYKNNTQMYNHASSYANRNLR